MVALENANDGNDLSEGQIIQLVNADGTQSNELYVLVAEDSNPGIIFISTWAC